MTDPAEPASLRERLPRSVEPTRARTRRSRPAGPEVVLGRYELLEVIGRGGQGTVHRALDRITRRQVAVKFVPAGSAEAQAWHAREVASLRRARIPGIVELLETGENDGWAIIVMALVDGSPFPGADAGPADWRVIVERGIAVLEASSQLHALGILHRDLKPANVLVSADGHVTLVDMGIAEDASDSGRDALEDGAVGTRTHMAPERLRGEPATPRSEVFAIGTMLLDALGAPRSGDMATAESAAPAWGERTDLPGGLAKLLMSMVAADAAKRPDHPREALELLRAVLGPAHEIPLPLLGRGRAVDAIVAAAPGGQSLDVSGPRGSGRTRVLREAASRLEALGHVTEWFQCPPALEPVERHEARDIALRQRLRDGVILLADDVHEMPALVREMLDDLRAEGAVIRTSSAVLPGAVEIEPLEEADLAALVDGPERVVHLPSQIARLLWLRTRGLPREVVRELRTWCDTGLASWNGRLEGRPGALERLRSMPPATASPEDAGLRLSELARRVWSVATLVAAPLGPEALADISGEPEGDVRAAIAQLAHAGFVHVDDSGRAELVRASPDLVTETAATRRAWRSRAARHLPVSSESRFEHLLASGEHGEACEVALAAGWRLLHDGEVPAALAILDRALTVARRHVPAAHDLYEDLLAAHAEASLARATRDAIDLATYHVDLAPNRTDSVRAWSRVLGAASSLLAGNSAAALGGLHGTNALPTASHRRAAHVIAHFAARSQGLDAIRERTREIARWARLTGGSDARAVLASAMGWLRYDEGRFEAAARLHACGARWSPRRRSRTTAHVDAAMAALEAGLLDQARSHAQQALRHAMATSDHVNDARAELALRQAALRAREPGDADEELLAAIDRLDGGLVRGTLRLTEAAFAWRRRRLGRAASLSRQAAADLAPMADAALLARALEASCVAVAASSDAAAWEGVTRSRRPGIAAQAVALAAPACGAGAMPLGAITEAMKWAAEAPRPEMPREILSPREILARLEPIHDRNQEVQS